MRMIAGAARGSTRPSLLSAFTVGLALWASPVSAASNSFSFPTGAATPAGGARLGSGATVILPASGNPSFFFNFVLPPDYKKNGAVKIVLYLSTGSACTARIVPVQMVRRRPGQQGVNSLVGLAGGDPIVDFPLNTVVSKVLTLKKGTALPGQRAGDAITLQVRREADEAGDNCPGVVFVQAIDIRYPVP